MPDAVLPTGTVTRGAITEHNGVSVETTGDGAHAAFATAHDALDAAVVAPLALDQLIEETTNRG